MKEIDLKEIFKKVNLKTLPAQKVKAPLIKDCLVNLECQVIKTLETGDHTLFVGQVIKAYLGKGKPLFNFGQGKLRGIN